MAVGRDQEMRWGVMGTGRIAVAMVEAIRAEGGEVVAVSSGSSDRARAFADEHGIAAAHGAHHDLLGDALDVVYVATTNDRHHADALACARAAVPVLVEKPFTLDRGQAAEVIAAAEHSQSFLMEAMWMRLQPGFLELERRIEAGQIGAVELVHADFGFLSEDPTGRLLTPALGGGALLDIGVYPLVLVLSLLGEPEQVQAVAEFTDRGVDRQVAVAMHHASGISSFVASFSASLGIEATVGGSEGSLHIQAPFHEVPGFSLRRGGEVVETVEVPDAHLGYRNEVREVHRCLEEGLVASPRMPWSFTRTTMTWLDAIRERIGLAHPPH
jgi:predicted dehydrogenase